MAAHRIFTTAVADVYPHYVAKLERKGRSTAELREVMCWLTGRDESALERALADRIDFETFFRTAPALNPSRRAITGTVCGVRVEDIEEPTMQEIRYLDKLVDELAKGRPMSKVLRS